MQICCYFFNLYNFFFLWPHVSLWLLFYLFPSPFSKTPEIDVDTVSNFSPLFLPWIHSHQDFTSTVLQKLLFSRSPNRHVSGSKALPAFSSCWTHQWHLVLLFILLSMSLLSSLQDVALTWILFSFLNVHSQSFSTGSSLAPQPAALADPTDQCLNLFFPPALTP